MIYPDFSLIYQVCPICNCKLHCKPTQVAKVYRCVNNRLNVNGTFGAISHYEFLRYNDNSVSTNYVIDDWWIMSDEEYSNINRILRSEKYIIGYSELGYRKKSMLLGYDNIDKIKNKLKLLNIFC